MSNNRSKEAPKAWLDHASKENDELRNENQRLKRKIRDLELTEIQLQIEKSRYIRTIAIIEDQLNGLIDLAKV